jgi:hypothetical protein
LPSSSIRDADGGSELSIAKIVEGDQPWSKDRLPLVEDRVRGRLRQLAQAVALDVNRERSLGAAALE